MSDGYLILDGDGRVVQADPTAADLLGRAVDGEFDGPVGSTAASLFARVTYAERSGDGEFEGEFVVPGADGRRYVAVESSDLEDDGVVIGRLVTLRDVTDRVRARDRLRREREELDTLFEAIADPVVEVAFDGDERPVVRRVNPAFEEVFGYDAATVRGEVLDEYIVPDGRADRAAEVNARAVDREDLKDEVVRRTADGERTFLLQVAVPEGESDAAFALYADITERERRQRDLERQNERLEEFASVVSHDLRNPLNVAQEYLAIARRTDDPDEFLDEVETSLDRMEAMIADVLTLAREGHDVADPDAVDLDAVAEAAWASTDTADAVLRVDGSLRFDADPDRLVELLENLYRNAIEHAGADVTVTVGLLDDRPGFFVADDGPGIPEGVRDSVFDNGVTTDPEGTGFGLAIADRIATAHGWTVELGDDEGGARFEFAIDGNGDEG
jgi:PAS domain S-box-containing protein